MEFAVAFLGPSFYQSRPSYRQRTSYNRAWIQLGWDVRIQQSRDGGHPPYLLLTLRLLLGILTLYLAITFSGGLKVKREQFRQLFGIGILISGFS